MERFIHSTVKSSKNVNLTLRLRNSQQTRGLLYLKARETISSREGAISTIPKGRTRRSQDTIQLEFRHQPPRHLFIACDLGWPRITSTLTPSCPQEDSTPRGCHMPFPWAFNPERPSSYQKNDKSRNQKSFHQLPFNDVTSPRVSTSPIRCPDPRGFRKVLNQHSTSLRTWVLLIQENRRPCYPLAEILKWTPFLIPTTHNILT